MMDTEEEREREDIARRLYNARHGLADEATGGNLAERDRDTKELVHAGGANFDLPRGSLPGASEYAAHYVDPMQRVDDAYEEGRTFDDATGLLRMAVSYWIHGSDETGRWLPDELQSSPLMLGLSIEHQAAIFVESTDLFESAKLFVWIAFQRQREVDDAPLPLARFVEAVNARLPHTFYPPRPEMSGEELERVAKAADAARQAEIDAKHIKRAPGMAKIFRGFNADWNQAA